MKVKLVATDLDGTLLKDDKSISPEDMEMLAILGEKRITRVVATGRNFKKVKEVLPDNTPVDYVAFSSGAGIYDWRNRHLIYSRNMRKETVTNLSEMFISIGLNFMVFQEVPENFRSGYFRGKKGCVEFERCLQNHDQFTEPLLQGDDIPSGACQFVAIFGDSNEFAAMRQHLEARFEDIKVIRSTSPLGTGYHWMEIFDADVSKGNAVKFLCDRLNIPRELTFSIGNDYNDLDMLDFTFHSYVVGNSTGSLRDVYKNGPGNEESALSFCMKYHL